MLHDQEAVVVLLRDGHELEDSEGAAHFQIGEVAIQPAEDAGVVATDEEDLVALQFQVAIEAPASSSTGAMRTLKVSGSRETVGRSSISIIKRGGSGDIRARQGGRAKVKGGYDQEKMIIIQLYGHPFSKSMSFVSLLLEFWKGILPVVVFIQSFERVSTYCFLSA